MKASIVAVGTEITTGQITNRNAAWLSERLVDMGIDVLLHETVPDDRPLILNALDRCRALTDLILVTGGLGPTTDDFTREVIADWVKQPLQWHEPSWQHILERGRNLGIRIPEINRRQCYFPAGSRVIENNQGTANAFGVSNGPTQLWIFPGPPREIDAVWNNGIEAAIRSGVPAGTRKLKLFTWQTIGKSEAELGVLTEAALQGSGLQIGYRAYRPYVEIKVWCPEDEVAAKSEWFKKLEAAIGTWVVTRQGADVAAHLLGAAARIDQRLVFIDSASGGALTERLGALLRKKEYSHLATHTRLITEFESPSSPELWITNRLEAASSDELVFALAGFSEAGEWSFGLRQGLQRKVETRKLAFGSRRTAETLERNRPLVVELALKSWREWLDGLQG